MHDRKTCQELTHQSTEKNMVKPPCIFFIWRCPVSRVISSIRNLMRSIQCNERATSVHPRVPMGSIQCSRCSGCPGTGYYRYPSGLPPQVIPPLAEGQSCLEREQSAAATGHPLRPVSSTCWAIKLHLYRTMHTRFDTTFNTRFAPSASVRIFGIHKSELVGLLSSYL